MVLSFEFWNDLKTTEKSKMPEIVKKHYLSIRDLEIAGKIMREGKLEDEWFTQLYISCTGCGLRKAHDVFEKYGIPEEERESLIKRLHEKFTNECNRGMFNN